MVVERSNQQESNLARETENGKEPLATTLAVWRPATQQWTILFEHRPYAAPLWALLFDPHEQVMASEHYGPEWATLSAREVIAEHVTGYRTTAGEARERLVERLGPVRHFPVAWKMFSLARALALSIAALPDEWPLRLDASAVTRNHGSGYSSLMGTAVKAAAALAKRAPRNDAEAVSVLLTIAHGMNPETPFEVPVGEPHGVPFVQGPDDGRTAGVALLGMPVDCPTSYVEAMTKARHGWEERWR